MRLHNLLQDYLKVESLGKLRLFRVQNRVKITQVPSNVSPQFADRPRTRRRLKEDRYLDPVQSLKVQEGQEMVPVAVALGQIAVVEKMAGVLKTSGFPCVVL